MGAFRMGGRILRPGGAGYRIPRRRETIRKIGKGCRPAISAQIVRLSTIPGKVGEWGALRAVCPRERIRGRPPVPVRDREWSLVIECPQVAVRIMIFPQTRRVMLSAGASL